MIVDFISFNEEWVKSVKESEFVKEFEDMDHIYPGMEAKDKKEALKVAYKKIKGTNDSV